MRNRRISKAISMAMAGLILWNQLAWGYYDYASALRPPAARRSGRDLPNLKGSSSGHKDTRKTKTRAYSFSALSLAFDEATVCEAKRERSRLKADYGFLPQDHLVVKYIKEQMARLYPDLEEQDLPSIEVLASKGEGVNTCIFPDNTIVVTPELLAFIEYDEELLFVLCHEMAHMDREHFKKMKDAAQRDSIREMYGLLRYQEYEADAAALHMMDERNVNPHGAFTFMNRIKQEGASWGPVHGTAIDRVLNIETMTFLKDIAALSYTLKRIPDWLRPSVNKVLSVKGNRIETITNIAKDKETYDDNVARARTSNIDIETRMRTAREADIYLVQETLSVLAKEVIENLNQLKRQKIKKDDHTSITALIYQDNIRVLKALSMRATELIRSYMRDKPEDFDFAVIGVLFDLTSIISDLQISDIYTFDDLENDFLQLISKDFKAALEGIKKYIFEEKGVLQRLGLVIKKGNDLKGFIKYLFFAAAPSYDKEEGFDFKNYLEEAHSFINYAKEYAIRTGLSDFSSEALWSDIVFAGIFNLLDLGHEETVPAYLRAVRSYEAFIKIDSVLLDSLIEKSDSGIINKEKLRKMLAEAGFSLFSAKEKIDAGSADEITTFMLKRYYGKDDKDYVGYNTDELDKYSVGDILKSLREIREAYPDIAYNIYSYLHHYIMAERIIDGKGGITYLERSGSLKERMKLCIQIMLVFEKDSDSFKGNLDEVLDSAQMRLPEQVEKLEFKDLEELSAVSGDIEAAERRLGISASLDAVNPEIETIGTFRLWTLAIMHKRLADAAGPAEFFDELKIFLNRYHLISYDEITGTLIGLKEKYDFFSMLDEIVQKGISYIRLDAKNGDKLDIETLKRLFMLSFFSRDIFVKSTVQEYLLPLILKRLSFSEAVTFLEKEFLPQKRYGYLRGWEYLIEEKADNTSDMDLLEEKIVNIFRLDYTDSLKHIGDMVGIDGFMEAIFGNQRKLLTILLKTSGQDEELKNFLFKIWWNFYKFLMDAHMINELKGRELEEWVSLRPVESPRIGDNVYSDWYFPLNRVLNLFYRMDYKGRYALLRKLLVGKNGVLTTQAGRRDLLKEFMDDYVSFEGTDTQIESIIKDAFGEFISVCGDDQLYFALYPIIIERIANPPQKPAPWQEISEFKDAVNSAVIIDKNAEALRSSLTEKILLWIYGYDHTKIREEELADSRLLSIVPEEARGKKIKKITPIGLIKEVAQRLGIPGVRFLQNLGQFIELPEEYESEFMEVCDDMVGQSRLSAYITLKRECPEYVKRIRYFGKRAGGGSLMTVYDVILDDGTEDVVKILNPNAEYFAKQSLEILRKVLTALSEKDDRYKQALPLLDDLEESIYKDLHDDNFISNDELFRKDNDGYSVKGFGLKILVPKSVESGSKKVIIERKVKGDNLTKFKRASRCSLQESLRQKEAVSLIARNYLDQIFLGGFSSKLKAVAAFASKKKSRVHSDIHPGNFRVTSDGMVAILDRNAFIELDKDDRILFYRINECKTNSERLKIFLDYLCKQPGNDGLSAEAYDIAADILTKLAKTDSNLEASALKMIIELKKHGVKVPLKITQVLRNLNALKRLAKKVGFHSLQEALEFNPGNIMAEPSGQIAKPDLKLERGLLQAIASQA